ncbi:MAG: tyrosine--tRNA ligase [Candidatus Roizmanbacteria bacterium]|nr:tyrosine--tRNA ligase [Candidatus Roizmanbacteria bacterium]
MTLDERLDLINQVGEEIITQEDLKALLSSDEQLIAYDGFEPSGQIHIAQGILKAINVNKMTKAGIKFKMFVADWHAYANNKMGGDLDKIKTVGKYFIEVWKACGMDLTNVEFVWASDLVKDPDYWKLVLQVGKSNALKRFVRTAEMMGRDESLDKLTGAHVIYSCMQVADIFTLGAKITQLGMDQRKVNMLAREVGPQLGYWKPVVVSHHMLMGLTPPLTTSPTPFVESDSTSGYPLPKGGTNIGLPYEGSTSDVMSEGRDVSEDKISRVIALKMSKSNPDSAIFMTDTKDDIRRKIGKAWAPEGVIEENPILEYCKYIIFESFDELRISRPDKFGGTATYKSYHELEQDYASKALHPMDLKSAVIEILNELLTPVRKHFEENEEAKKLLEQVKTYQVTR